LVAAIIAQLFEIDEAQVMVDNQDKHQHQLDLIPERRTVVGPVEMAQPSAQQYHRNHRGGGNATIEFALHDLETVATDLIFAHAVIDKQSWQIEECGKPGD